MEKTKIPGKNQKGKARSTEAAYSKGLDFPLGLDTADEGTLT